MAMHNQRTRSTCATAFRLMLDVKRALTTGMLTYDDGRFTILESSEDAAADLLEAAIGRAERRGRDRELRRRRHAGEVISNFPRSIHVRTRVRRKG